ncbi:MAG: hypothetical protein KBC34_14965 [Phenylobacterium sp.]|nr:hypothetical protein [Phenylobacterium sp.]
MTSITSVTAVTGSGAYKAGATVTLAVEFDSAVLVDATGGGPTLSLSSGGTATYAGGDGSTTLTFNYVVGPGETSADLDYVSTSALALNGAAITDAATHMAADLTLAAPGAAGSLGANANIVIDTAAPGITGAAVRFWPDTGTSDTDLITNTAAQTLSGTLTGSLAAGETVQVSLNNGANWTAASSAGSIWTLSGQTLTGSNTLKVRVVDAAGNQGVTASYAYVLDTTPPPANVTSISLSNDTGTSSSDFVTNAAAQTISGTATSVFAAGDRVLVSLDNGAAWATASTSGATWSLSGQTLSSSNTLQVQVVDTAGNGGPVASQAYVLDTTAPTTTVATLALSADTGASASDFVTKTAAQTISGTLSANLAADESVQVSTDNGASWTTAAATAGSNTWSLSGVTLVQSDTLQARVVDAAGNEGTSLSQAYTYDTVAPTGLSNVSLSNDTGASSTDFVTKVSAQTISGVLGGGLTGGDSVWGSLDDGATWTDITAKVSGGTLTWDGVTLTGSSVLQLQVVDLAGNASTVSKSYMVDASAAAPSAPDLSAASDTGASSTDNVTSDTTPTFTGTSEANATVSLFDTDGTTVLGTATADGSGNWSITSSTLALGQHTVSAAIIDLAGNTSSAGAGLQITIQAATPPPGPPPPSVVVIVTPFGSQITGDGGANLIAWSRTGADTIAAGAGNDTLTAGPNNDVLQGNTGADSISAGLGADVVRGGQGDDVLNGNQDNDLVFGDLGDDSVSGGKGDDFVHGNAGDDVLLGDLGDDIVLGGQGHDTLFGGDGADHLSGDKGDDVLIGGAGADLFGFAGGAGRDVVADFSHAQGDHIALSVAQATDFQALSGKMAMVGADTVITLDGLTIVLAGVPMSSLVAGDFVFS